MSKRIIRLRGGNPNGYRVRVESSLQYKDGGVFVAVDAPGEGKNPGAQLTRDQALELYEALGAHLASTQLDAEPVCDESPCCADLPDAESDGYSWGLTHRTPDTILQEAQAAVYGPREGDYGHPREDFTRQAILYTGLLQHKLAEGAFIDAEDIPRLMIATKLARDVHTNKRDNRVDMAGYALTLDRLETGR